MLLDLFLPIECLSFFRLYFNRILLFSSHLSVFCVFFIFISYTYMYEEKERVKRKDAENQKNFFCE